MKKGTKLGKVREDNFMRRHHPATGLNHISFFDEYYLYMLNCRHQDEEEQDTYSSKRQQCQYTHENSHHY